MHAPSPSFRLVSLLAAGGSLVAAAVFCLTPNRGRAAPPTFIAPPHVVIRVAQKVGPMPASTSSGPALPPRLGPGGNGSAAATSQQTWLEITVSNVGDSSITGLTINYHVFSKTSTIGKTATVTMTDNSGTQSVDIPYEKSIVLKTSPTIKAITNNLPSAGNGGGAAKPAKSGKTATTTPTTTVTNIAGWYVEAVTNDPAHPVETSEDPQGIVAQYESLQSQASH